MYAVMRIELDGLEVISLEYPSLEQARSDYRKLISCQARFARVGIGSQMRYIPRRAVRSVAVREMLA